MQDGSTSSTEGSEQGATSPLPDPTTFSGTTAGTARPGAEPALAEPVRDLDHTILAALLAGFPACAYASDRDGRILAHNAHAAQLWGRLPSGDAAERYCGPLQLLTADGASMPPDGSSMARAIREGRTIEAEPVLVARPDGLRLSMLAYSTPVRDPAGNVRGGVHVLLDVTQQRQAEDVVREAMQEKTELIATMSRELRMPVTAIIGYADLLDMELAGPLNEKQRQHVTRLRAATRHLLSLVSEMLDFSRAQSGAMPVRREPRRALDAIEGALAVVQPLALARGITLVNRSGRAKDLLYEGDEDRLRQILIQLLSNGIKFTDPPGAVEISCGSAKRPQRGAQVSAVAPSWGWIRIRDTGLGIPPQSLERVFEPFVQLDVTRTRVRGGAGLGLSLARRLARLMGGDLMAQSIVGHGSVFAVWLPGTEARPDTFGPAAALPMRTPQHGAAVPEPDEQARKAFAVAGRAILSNLSAIMDAYVGRLRASTGGPGSHVLARAHLAGHTGTLLAEIATMLQVADQGDAAVATFGPSSALQRACAIEHGRQRGHLGWSEKHLVRDYETLWEETARILQSVFPADQGGIDGVLLALRGRLDAARAVSVNALASAHLLE